MVKDTLHRRGISRKGTHGSLSKAGKMKQLHQRQFREDRSKSRKGKKGNPTKGDLPKYGKKHAIPRVKRRKQYNIATLCKQCGNRIQIGINRCWRCSSKIIWKGVKPIIAERGR